LCGFSTKILEMNLQFIELNKIRKQKKKRGRTVSKKIEIYMEKKRESGSE
jgi:uncharacterized iron-regulated protein